MTENSLRRHLEENHREAVNWARQCCRFDEEAAREVLQVTYLKILEKKAVWKEHAAFRTWLFSVIRFTAIDHLRGTRMYASLTDAEGMETLSDTDQGGDYRELIGMLPERQAEVMLLVFYHDMTLEQVAHVMELQIGTVRTHYDRGKKTLRNLLTKRNEGYAERY